MIFDTSQPIAGIKNILDGYYGRIESLQTNLLTRYNLNRHEGDLGYADLWGSMTYSGILTQQTYSTQINHLISISQYCNNTLDSRYMNLVGMVMSLDNYICYISDAFSRIADCSWAFGDGSIYQTLYGKKLDDGSYEIVRKGLLKYTEEIDKLIKEMESKYSSLTSMSSDQLTEAFYESLRDDFFLEKIRAITLIIDEKMLDEINLLIGIVNDTKAALDTWLPETFQLVSYISLAFNLNKKLESLTDKVLNINSVTNGEPASVLTLLAISTANYWKKEISPDGTNRGHCLTQAILHGCRTLLHPARLKSYIEKSWVIGIQKY